MSRGSRVDDRAQSFGTHGVKISFSFLASRYVAVRIWDIIA